LWELGIKTAGVARARELDPPRGKKLKMAEEAHSLEGTPANFYRFAYSVVEQTIARLESLNEVSEMDGLIMRLEYLNRSLANLDSPDTDEIMLLIGEAISCMSRDRSLSLEFDSVNFPHRVSTQRRGRPSFEIKQEQLSFLLEEGFKVPTIAQLFCVSTRTIERKMAAYGLSVSGMKFYCHDIEIIFYSCELLISKLSIIK